MSEHERIWLEPAPGADEEYGRQWCQHNVWPNGVEYVRADLTIVATAFPVPRGGIEPDWHAACTLLRRRFRKLEKAAGLVISEADGIHDNEPWPLKYRAPYAAITKLRETLSEVGTPALPTHPQTTR